MKKLLLALMALIAFLGGLWVFGLEYDLSLDKAIFYTLQLFVVDVETVKQIGLDHLKEDHPWIYRIAILAALTTFITVIMIFLKLFATHIKQFLMHLFGGHTIVIGLGANSRYFLDSEIESGNKRVIVIEKDSTNPHLNRYKDSGVVLLTSYIDEIIDKIGIRRVKHILISAGDDRENINIALKILEYDQSIKWCKKDSPKLSIHIEDKMLRNLYHGETLLVSKRFDIVPFSYFEDAAIALFETHDIDGEDDQVIQSHKAFHIAVVGDSQLAIEVIEQACKIAHLPNENHLTIHSLSSDAKAFKQKIDQAFPLVDQIPTITIEYHSLDIHSKEFYYDGIFTHIKNLTHIIFCDLDQEKNISSAIKLTDITYRKQIVENSLKTKIHFALFTNSVLARKINAKNSVCKKDSCNAHEVNYFKNLHAFANARDICHKDNLLGSQKFTIGQIVDYDYGSEYKRCPEYVSKEVLLKNWKGRLVNDKASSIAQAEHINLKLKALGLTKKRVHNKTYDKLQTLNKGLLFLKLDAQRKALKIDDEALFNYSKEIKKSWDGKEYKIHYMPKEYTMLFEKLIRSEHNRWNAYHYLLGFTKADKTCKSKKEHMCLTPLEKFTTKEQQITVIYDIYSLLYLPSYLAHVGYEIVERKFFIAVTGHRDIKVLEDLKRVQEELENIESQEEKKRVQSELRSHKEALKKLRENIEVELRNICANNKERDISVVSALAKGADMLVAEVADEIGIKVEVVLPYEKEHYLKSFEDEKNKEHFEKLLAKAKKITVLPTKNHQTPAQAYENLGDYLTKNTDTLIALWDGKYNGKQGGTGEVVKMIKRLDKPVVHIKVDRGKVS
jgi:hypothetical protein